MPLHHDSMSRIPPVPPALIGLLLFLAVALAIAFYVAAQVVQTP